MTPKLGEAHTEARRRQIIDAARACFIERGFHATTIQDISKRAGLSTGASYRYFESKHDIVAAMCAESLDRNRQRFSAVDVSGTSRAIFEQLIELYFTPAHRPGAVEAARLSLQVWEESARSEATGIALRADFETIGERLAEIIGMAQRRGDIDAGLDSKSVAQAMVSLVLGLMVQRATGVSVDTALYEEAARSLVTGGFWTGPAEPHMASGKTS